MSEKLIGRMRRLITVQFDRQTAWLLKYWRGHESDDAFPGIKANITSGNPILPTTSLEETNAQNR